MSNPLADPNESLLTEVDELAEADAAVARRTRFIRRPLRRLVNAPHLLVGTILAIWVGSSLAYSVIERKGPIEGLWWAIVTGSTVGYGDQYPESTAGRGIGAFLIISMLVLIPIAIGHVIASLVHDKEQLAIATVLEDQHERIDRVEHLLIASMVRQHGEDFVRRALDDYEAYDASTVDAAEQMLAMFRTADQD